VSEPKFDATAVLIPESSPSKALPEPESSLWLSVLSIHEGQSVDKGQTLARLEREEGVVDIVSPRAGYVVGLHILPGQTAQPGQVLCYIASRPSISATQPAIRLTAPASFDPSSLILFGGGGHGKILIDLIRAMGTYRLVGIIDDGLLPGSDVMGVPVLGGVQSLEEWYSRGVRLAANGVGGIGNVDSRLRIFDILEKAGFACPVLIHPAAVVERSASLSTGAQILAQAYVGGNVRVGFGTVLNVGVIVSHDSVLGKVVNLSPGATLAGGVKVDNYTQIGMRATVNVNISIGERSLLGNGCTVKANVPPHTRIRAGTIWPVPKLI